MIRLGVRARTSVSFAVGALAVSASLASGTYELTRHALLVERERTAVRAAYFDAAVVRQGISSDGADIVDVLRTLDTGQEHRALLYRNGRWYSRSADTSATAAVPASLRRLVQRGGPGVQRVRLNGAPTVVVGVPLGSGGADYYELTTQVELQRTLRRLALSLVVMALLTTAAAAALGHWATRRLLRPLTSVVAAARAIAGGELAARVEPSADPDLAPLTTAFNDMVRKLADRMERDRRFAADVSHELRSPLQTLTAATAVLENRRLELDQRSAAAAALIVAEVARFNTLVTDLLDLARAEQPLQLTQVALDELVPRRCRDLGLPARVVSVPAGLTWPLDVRRFERILANLVQNAASHAGGATRVVCRAGDRELHVTVDDAGPGIPPEDRQLVFARFGRGRRASARGSTSGSGTDGTGLGLSLVAQHVAAHGGTVTIGESDVGGARFDIIFPRPAP